MGTGKLPDDYTPAYICHVIGITYTELLQQPEDWVYKTMAIHQQKSKAEEMTAKKQQPKTGRHAR